MFRIMQVLVIFGKGGRDLRPTWAVIPVVVVLIASRENLIEYNQTSQRIGTC
jgi:hypothetical protein